MSSSNGDQTQSYASPRLGINIATSTSITDEIKEDLNRVIDTLPQINDEIVQLRIHTRIDDEKKDSENDNVSSAVAQVMERRKKKNILSKFIC